MVRESPVHVSSRISNFGSISEVQNYILLEVSYHSLRTMTITHDNTLKGGLVSY